jgi:RNA polymerase sigma factor (sigma-70 family)
MEDRDDRDLLRRFNETRDERAFAELVRRHVDLVYSAARRQTLDQAAAQDVTQTVFILLIEKADTIRAGEALAGWLLVTTRFAALNLLRAESRRRRHESEAAGMKTEQTPEPSSRDWDQIQPMLDDAVSGLSTSDRDALVLRYFQNKSLADVGRAMGISEPAAQKRVNRALHRLREFFARQGITTSAEVISSAMSAFAIAPAPVGDVGAGRQGGHFDGQSRHRPDRHTQHERSSRSRGFSQDKDRHRCYRSTRRRHRRNERIHDTPGFRRPWNRELQTGDHN